MISKRLYAVRGVKNVSLDAASRTFFVESDANAPLSPWSLMAAVEQSGLATESITGPQGVFTIERSAEKAARAPIQHSKFKEQFDESNNNDLGCVGNHDGDHGLQQLIH